MRHCIALSTSPRVPRMADDVRTTDIWTIDQPAIWEQIRQRNALRRSAFLPLLDEWKEFHHACKVIREARWYAFKDSKRVDYERFRKAVWARWGRASGWIDAWARSNEVDKQ